MGKIDKTKKNIRIEAISRKTRKELYNKFIEAGGEIIEEEEIFVKNAKHGIFDRGKQAAYRKLLDSYQDKKSSKKSASGKDSAALQDIQKELIKSYSEYRQNPLISFSQRLMIRFRLFFMGMTDFSGDTFNNKFFHLLNTEYKTSLIGIKMLYLELFKQKKDLEHSLIFELDKINRHNTTLLENVSKIYDATEINIITAEYQSARDTIQSIYKFESDLISLFRKIYTLKPYEHIILTAFNSAIEIHMKLTGKKSSYYYKKRKNIKDDLYVVFERLFQNLYWLVCRYNNRIIPLGSQEFEKLLNIKPLKTTVKKIKSMINEDTGPGNITEEETDKKEDAEEKEKIELSDEIKAGLMLMKDLTYNNIAKLRAEYDYTKTYHVLADNDKMLLIYIILQEFDNEYSFLLTTSKIKYKFDKKDSNNSDLKEKLLDYYDDIKKCMDCIKEYSETSEIFNNIKNEKPYSNDRYISYTKNLNAADKRREQAANTARFSIFNLTDNILSVFKLLIDDINGAKKYIEYPDEKLDFDTSIEGHKKLNNKTIHEAMTAAYNFASAFAFRLTTEGDLSGSLEFDAKNNKNYNEILSSGETKATDTASPDEKSDEKGGEGKSIIDEIDDIFTE